MTEESISLALCGQPSARGKLALDSLTESGKLGATFALKSHASVKSSAPQMQQLPVKEPDLLLKFWVQRRPVKLWSLVVRASSERHQSLVGFAIVAGACPPAAVGVSNMDISSDSFGCLASSTAVASLEIGVAAGASSVRQACIGRSL